MSLSLEDMDDTTAIRQEEMVDGLCYITRMPGAIITEETFEAAIQFYRMKGDTLHALLEDVTCLHAPQVALSFYKNKSIKDDYTKSMHCFTACLTDDWYKKAGNTVLYIPMEALQCTPTEACKDKKLVQRMEIMMIHWMDQIKELLNTQQIMENRDNYGPLQEITFWKSRFTQLSEISKQLQKPEVKHILDIVLLSKSLYVQEFCQLATEIQESSLQAQSNKTFLSILKEPCEELFQLKPRQIVSKLQHIVSLIRIIWINSPHYNDTESIARLLCQMSNEIIHLCTQSLSLDKIFDCYLSSSKQDLQDCIHCCVSWKETYLHVSQLHHKNLQFEDDQTAHQQSCLLILCSVHQDILNIVTDIHSIFVDDGTAVQEHWATYTEKVNRMVEEGFLSNISNSMKKLSGVINCENKILPNPLFKVLVVLQQTSAQGPPKVEFSPSLSKLAQIVNILPQLISVISEFKQIPDLFKSNESQANPIYVNIEQDEGIKKIQAAITAGMSANASHLQAYLKSWDKYRAIWEMNKDFFIQRYKRKNHPVSSFDADIQRYTENANNIQQEETIVNIQFVTLDCSPLKSSLVQHCNEWQTKFTELLLEVATIRLQELYGSMQDNANRLRQSPQTLADLGDSLKLLETFQGSLTKTETQISLIHEQFTILDKYEVYVEKSVQAMHEGLNEEWVGFQQVLINSDILLQKHKEKFKNNLVLSYEDFKKKIEATVDDFNARGPFQSALSTDSALNKIAEHRTQLETLKDEQNAIFDGLAFYKINQPPSKIIQMLEKDIDQLQSVWEITVDWDSKWNDWKVVQLAKLQTETMESTAQEMFKKLHILQRELKGKEWDVVDFSKMKIEHFKHIIPLITDLRNPAMRDRHWKQLCEELQCSFDHNSPDFTLEMIISLGLDRYTNKICEISGAASKELLIEQMIITASQIKWTSDVTSALVSKENDSKSSLKSLKKKQVSILQIYSEMIRNNLPKVLRLKIVALVTVEVHARDVIEKLLKVGCNDVNAFEWLCQLRHYYENKEMNCFIRQTNTQFNYGYEYLGNSGRLVITPLTDRCYMTLTTALHLHRGGSPKGPAGTGKTETVKDLGKALGMYVIVVNCSEGLDYKSMGRMFAGLAQTGAWGCFDEFNRINIEVLSVVAQQILSILSSLSAGQSQFIFEGHNIRLVPSCGVFITMNPGYAGRTELPDNLKSMFRPISMVVPDSTLIAEILLFGEGFDDCKLLAKKVFTLYSLAVQQLSKQDHYDFGLRALTSLLRYAGKKRRASPGFPDKEVLLMAMKDMNIAKLTSADLPLFNGIIQDLFPAVETSATDYDKLKEAVEVELQRSSLQVTPFTMTKVIQLYKTKNSRHSSMLVGKTGSAKSVTWRTLQNALTTLHDKGEPGFQQVQVFPLNPKSMSLGELYGENDLSTNEWTDGVLSSLMRSACADEKPDEKWIVFDGPVDTLWIESMNSVMDDNKVLTLINGERISMPEQVSLLFEVENLAMASPATVSRCGMVYNDYVDLGWRPFVQSWLEKRHKAEVEHLKIFFEKYLESTLNFKRTNCKELIPTTELNGVTSLCRLYDSLATPSSGVNPSDKENLGRVVELWFVFSLIWSICASVDEDGRGKMDNFLREMEGTFPVKETVYEYYVDPKNHTWISFEDQLPKGWRYNAAAPFYKIMVPTVDTVRYNLLVKALVMSQYPVLLTGPVGTGKTSLAQSVLQELDNKWAALTINMSSQTTSNNIQAIIESRTEKRTKGVFVPAGGKKMVCFLDDLNMPALDLFGSQPPLELLRFWIDYGFWYDHQKRTLKLVKDMFLLASMGPPGGGRTQISARFQSGFNLINMTFPNESQIKSIYSTMITQRLQGFKEEVKPAGEIVTQATLDLYNAVTTSFLPTPAKIHYLFNLRDISKVFQGLLRAHPDFQETQNGIIRLWIHECFRVFSDRLVNESDMNTFVALLEERLTSLFNLTFHSLCPNKQPPIFGDFLNNSSGYEDILDVKVLKKFMETQLEDYNLTPGVVPMSLVLFQDAIEHITRVVRVISQLRGNMLLIGIGGSGRQSLSKMAAFVCEYQVFQVEVSKQYRKQEFREDIKKLYRLTGVDNKPTVFLFNDTQIVDESFLEDINNILSSGEVPNLYKQDEFAEVCNTLSEFARKDNVLETPDSLFSYLIERVRNNLHIVLCMSPVGEPFRNRILQYPAIVNCTTIDWFCEWPKDALLEVAERYLDGLDLGSLKGIHRKVASIFVTTHQSVAQVSESMKSQLKRYNYVTPTNYLELVSGYKKLLAEKRNELGEQVTKLRNGLFKISDTREKVEAMTVELEEAKKQVDEFQKQCDQYLAVMLQQKNEASEQQKVVSRNREKISAEELQCKAMAETAQRDLDKALPALEEAMKALESLNKKDMTEIKSYGRPPVLVETVMNAVMTLLGKEPTWAEAKRQLGEANFIKTLVNFDKDNMSDRVLKKINQFCRQADFQPEIIGKVSLAAKSLCMWVKAMEVYGRIYRDVEPKRAQLTAALSQLTNKQTALAKEENKLHEVGEKLDQLQKQYAEKAAMKDSLKKKSDEMEMKLDRADKLVMGLAGERIRWEERVTGLEENMGYLVGDCLLAASFLSYMGPFLSNYRDELLAVWKQKVVDVEIPCTPGFSFAVFLSKPTTVRDWNIQGLPSDAFSTENGVIITRGNRWPLIVDPQGQALKWIQNMEMENGLKLIDFQMPDYLRVLENAIQFGKPVVLQNVQENLDPSLNPVFNKSLTQIGGRLLLKLGDKEVEYNPEFRFYVTTKLSNPHYTPEISSVTTIVNFAVKEQGLEAQLLGIVVRKERPELEQQKDTLVIRIADGKKRLQDLEDEILRYTCQGLFEAHKLLFSFQMCVKFLEVTGNLNESEYNFLLRKGLVLDKNDRMDNPCADWLSDSSWDDITELEKLPNFYGIASSFEQYRRDWNLWFTNSEPEKAPLPDYWVSKCNDLQKMLIVRCLRQDRISFCITSFIVKHLGPQFVEPPVLNMQEVVDESTSCTPLIFVLSPGVDPTGALLQLAEASGMSKHFHALSLGQGQALIARRKIEEGVKDGHWVFLANCHLSLSWMPELDKLIKELQVQKPHSNFRLWLSSSPHPQFPITILQAGIKMTTEPPKGVKANMKRLYQLVTDAQFNRCSRPTPYKKLLFSLCFFHSVLLERKKFGQMGWNIVYGFNDSDFEVSENLLCLYLDKYKEIPWDALKYLIADVSYGGHVTDDWDRRLLTTYINDYFCDAAINQPHFKLSVLPTYHIPTEDSHSAHQNHITKLPSTEHPEVFGQHPNADIASQIAESRTLFDTLLSLQPQVTSATTAGTRPSREDTVLELLGDIRGKIPALIDCDRTRTLLQEKPSPLNVVLLQEIQRYNSLLETIVSSLVELEKGIKGFVVMSSGMEETFNCMYDARVPPLWEKAYPSLKPLAAWTRDLCQRVDQFARWARTTQPPVLFWLSGFTLPNGFLTAVLQSTARQNKISVDTLSWEFIVSTVDDTNLLTPPKDGVYIKGLFLEGAGWDKANSCLVEAKHMQMVCPIPTICFKPVENCKNMSKSAYSCPCYYFPVRAGRAGQPSFVVGIELKSGAATPHHWIKRGTALLMSLDS
ncbi:dynein heavy chain 2, axonemal [Nematolebias whitei]|uniref:dynein heavy chain 2, axonemal n=1 Tax=Nematolebias whitei TaxID=451745 RepID=UPI001899B6EF|nr:dynein heavy chain 2, axonemal [Nematolebias whitei]